MSETSAELLSMKVSPPKSTRLEESSSPEKEALVSETTPSGQLQASVPQETQLGKKEIRAFTKSSEEGRWARRETAAEIIGERLRVRDEIEQITNSLPQMMEKLEAEELKYAPTKSKIDRLSRQIAIRNAFLIKSVFDRIQPGETEHLENKREGLDRYARRELENTQDEIDRWRERLSELQEERKTFKRAKEILAKFYETHKEKLIASQQEAVRKGEERRQSAIEKVAEKHQVYFLHAIRPDTGALNFLVLNDKDVSWRTKLEIVVGIQPEICSSTLKNDGGDTLDGNAFGRMGVVLSGGTVEYADPLDVFSYPNFEIEGTHFKGKRRPRIGKWRLESVPEQIEDAIEKRGEEGWNELVVSDPKIAGFFIGHRFDGDETQAPLRRLIPVLKGINMPLFLFRDGAFYEQKYEIDNRGEITIEDLDPTNKDGISPTEMVRRKYEIPEEQRISVRNRALRVLAPVPGVAS